MEEFLEWLKEEALPGVWSKGVAFSRNSKSVEKISAPGETKELKFKIQTTERLLAFQVTIWPADQDAHCNCDSKIEPCHHVVAVALASVAGLVTEGSAAPSAQGSTLRYTWVVENQKISLKREILVNSVARTLEGSLIGLIGGIQSGRIKAPLPSTTLTDLKLDEIFAKENPKWIEIFKALSELPPLPVNGLSGKTALQVDSVLRRPELLLEDAQNGAFQLRPAASLGGPVHTFQNGVSLDGETLFLSTTGNSKDRVEELVTPDRLEIFLRERLPALQGDYEVKILSERLPTLVWKEPFLSFNAEPLGEERLSITPSIRYPTPGPKEIVARSFEDEKILARELREKFALSNEVPAQMTAEAALNFRTKLQKEGFQSENVDTFLASFFKSNGNLSLENALQNQEAILRLLALREKRPALKKALPFLLQSFQASSVAPSEQTQTEVNPKLWMRLRDYQKRGVQWLLSAKETLGGAILSDDMGLGKTIQTLSILKGPALVVAPTSLLKNWQNEATLFRPDLKTQIFHGPNRKWDANAELTITSYALLRLEAARFLETFWDTVVLDEAHIIRNPETQAAVASFQLSAHFKVALTGTPIQNKRRDLLSLFQFVTPDVFQSEEELRPEATSAFLLRRTKDQVLTELPPKTHLVQNVSLNEKERKLYDAVWATAKKEVVERLADSSTNPFTLFEVLLRARQVCDHPGLIDPELKNEISSKCTVLLDLIDELIESGHSVLVYSQWTKFLDLLEPLVKARYPMHRLDGSTQNRGDVVDEFQNNAAPSVFLLSLHAGGVGLNLTRASHVIFCDPWWNPFVELQAEDRAYRMGQEKPVTIHRLLTENTIEEQIRDLQIEKLKLGEGVFTKEDLSKIIG